MKKPRFKKTRKLYPWNKTEIGREALCWILLYAYKFGTDEDHYRKEPLQLGLTALGMENYLRMRLPYFFKVYEDYTGNPLTGKIIMSRFGNMYRENPTKEFANQGSEHPKRHPDLRPVLLRLIKECEVRGYLDELQGYERSGLS